MTKCHSKLEMALQHHPQSHPVQRMQNRRAVHTTPSYEQLQTAQDKQERQHKLYVALQALPCFQQTRWIRVLALFPGLFCSLLC